MTGTAQLGRDTLEGALYDLGTPLDRYLAAPDDAQALEAARTALRRLYGSLSAAGLRGTAAFCAELGTALDELRPGLCSALHCDVLQHALDALARQLGALASGADDVALHLFPEYQALQQLRGLETSFEPDLFRPALDVQLPREVLEAPPEKDPAQRLKMLRSQYQQGLLHWLRRDDAGGALRVMQQSLDGALRCLPQDHSRAFWWVAGGLFECLRLDGLPAGLDVRRLLGHIDQQLRAAAEGGAGDAPLMDEMLYLVAHSQTAGDRTEDIRLAYALDCYLPGRPAPFPEALREHLRAAEENWERCVQGNRSAGEKFIVQAEQLAAQAEPLGRHPLRYLAGQIRSLSQYARSTEYTQLFATDMAMALLLMGRGLRHHDRLGSGFLKEARLLAGRMQAAVRQQPEEPQQPDELVRLHCLLEQGDALSHLLNEMLANLQYVAQGLNAFFSNPAVRGELKELLRLSAQMQGGLHIATLERAERLLSAIQNSMHRFVQSDDLPEQTDSESLLCAVQALEGYLQQLAHGERGNLAALQASLDDLAGLQQAAAETAAAAEPPRAPAEPVRPAGEDEELLEVFLEEAQEVLHALRNNLEACRLRPDDREPLVNVRRSFHTLKGSGRMVGLTELGEVAWNVERALNKWLQDDRPASPALLDFVADAERRFTGWVDALNSQGGVLVEAGDLVAAAQRIESGGEAEPTAAQALPAQPSVPGRPPLPEQPSIPAAAEKAPVLPPVAPAAGKPPVRDEIDAQLLPVFLEEADELCPRIGAGLRAWRTQPDDPQQTRVLGQLLHTLKGSARMAGAMRLGSMVHEMEERLLSAAPPAAVAELQDMLEGDFDRVTGLIERLRGSGVQAEPADTERPGEPAAAAEHAMLRVRADLVDRLVSEAGEISLARARMEAEIRAFKEGLLELTGSVARLRKQLREIEMQAEGRMQAHAARLPDSTERFDPLEFDRFTRMQELTRFMNESVHDVQTVQQALLKNFDAASAALAAQGRLNRELQQNLMNVRMVPFASIGERLYRVVRQTAQEQGKHASLELLGAELELDRSMLEKMTAPFEHLLRNALVHGIEGEAERLKSGKNPVGTIRLALRHEGNEVVFELGDDGAGLNLPALRAKAVARGLLKADEAVGDERLAQLVFASGISTATEVTEVAGRGIGMDVVCNEVAALGGRIEVSSRKGQGTQFTLRLPLTLAATHVLMVRSATSVYAIPSAMVEQVRQVKPAELAQLRREGRIEWQEHLYPLHYLPHLLGDAGGTPEEQKHSPLVLLRSGSQRIALQVDGLLGNQEAMVKNTGPQLAQLPVISGATIQGNGTVALILNPAQLAQRIAAAPPEAGTAAPGEPAGRPLVMVVDDSLTVRKVTTRLLTRAGYRIATAKDGVDALEQLGETLPDVMLLDIEMPRMDGFELTKHLRRDARTQQLPIIMITSRAADKHRDYALQLGVNAYLGKPYQEEELLQQIAGFAPAQKAG